MASNPTVRNGSRGEWVEYLQQMLEHLGFDPGNADGSFGRRTRAAVVAFQQSKGLTADGVVGPRTWAAIAAGDEEGGDEEGGERGREGRGDDDDEERGGRRRRRRGARGGGDGEDSEDEDEDEDEDDEDRPRRSRERRANRTVQVRGDLTVDEAGWAVLADIDNRTDEDIAEGDVEFKLTISGDVDEEEEGEMPLIPADGLDGHPFELPDLEDGEYTVKITLDPEDGARETAEIQITIEDGELKSRARKQGGRHARLDFEDEPRYEDGKVIVTVRNTGDDTLEAGDVVNTLYARSEVDDWDDSQEVELEDDLEADDTTEIEFRLAGDVPEGEVEATITLDSRRDGPEQRFTFYAEEGGGGSSKRDKDDEDEDDDDRGGRSRKRDDEDEDEDDDRGGRSRKRGDDEDEDDEGGRTRTAAASGESALTIDREPNVDDSTLTYAARNESYETLEANSIWDQLTVVDADGEVVLEETRAHAEELAPGDIYQGEFDISSLRKGEYSGRLWLDYGRQGPTSEFGFTISRGGEAEMDEDGADFDFSGSTLSLAGTPEHQNGYIYYWCSNDGRKPIPAGVIVDAIYITSDDGSWSDAWQQVWEEEVEAGDQ